MWLSQELIIPMEVAKVSQSIAYRSGSFATSCVWIISFVEEQSSKQIIIFCLTDSVDRFDRCTYRFLQAGTHHNTSLMGTYRIAPTVIFSNLLRGYITFEVRSWERQLAYCGYETWSGFSQSGVLRSEKGPTDYSIDESSARFQSVN